MKATTILLADDHHMIREGLRLLIDAQTDLKVIREASSASEVLDQISRVQPEIVLLDISTPGLKGLQTVFAILSTHPQVKVVVLTVCEDESFLMAVRKSGAAGCVFKKSPGRTLLQALRAVAAGNRYFESKIAEGPKKTKFQELPPMTGHLKPGLSQREREVLVLLAWGHSNKEIGADLGVSAKTIETYRVRIAKKLGLRSRTDMVHFALQRGWMDHHAIPRLAGATP